MKEVDWNKHLGEKVIDKNTGEIRTISVFSKNPSVTLFDEKSNRDNWIGFAVGSPISKNWELYKEPTTSGEFTYGDLQGDITISDHCEHNNIQFNTKECENIIELKENGDIFVKGKLIENDKQVVDAMRELLGFDKIEKSLSDMIWTQEEKPIYHDLPDMVSVKNIKKSIKILRDKINHCLEHQGECKCGNDHSVNLHFMEAINESFGPKLT